MLFMHHLEIIYFEVISGKVRNKQYHLNVTTSGEFYRSVEFTFHFIFVFALCRNYIIHMLLIRDIVSSNEREINCFLSK
jgi:hypothetical protein